MNPAVERAARTVLQDWRREADGSRSMADLYTRRAEAAEEDGKLGAAQLLKEAEADAQQYLATAAEHRKDAERAEAAAVELEDALRAEGLEP